MTYRGNLLEKTQRKESTIKSKNQQQQKHTLKTPKNTQKYPPPTKMYFSKGFQLFLVGGDTIRNLGAKSHEGI